MATPLTEDKNLKMPEAFGGSLGMDKRRLEQAAANEAMRLGGGQITPESVARTIQTPYGVMSSSGEYKDGVSKRMTQADFDSSRGGMQIQGGTRTPEEQQTLLAKMRETGAGIRQNIADTNLRGDRSGYYAFRQGLEERRAAEALTPSFGGNIGRDATMRGAQALVQAERWKQVAGGERGAMSREPISAMGMEFRNVGMGQVAPILGSQQSQPWQNVIAQGGLNQGMTLPRTSFGGFSQGPTLSPTTPNLYSLVGRPAVSPELSATQFGERLQQAPFSGLMTAIGGPQPRRRSVAKNLPAFAGSSGTTYIPLGFRS